MNSTGHWAQVRDMREAAQRRRLRVRVLGSAALQTASLPQVSGIPHYKSLSTWTEKRELAPTRSSTHPGFRVLGLNRRKVTGKEICSHDCLRRLTGVFGFLPPAVLSPTKGPVPSPRPETPQASLGVKGRQAEGEWVEKGHFLVFPLAWLFQRVCDVPASRITFYFLVL